MPLIVYRDVPFTTGNDVDQDDFFTGDGVTTAFTLSRKTVSRLAGTVQFDNTQYYQYNGGFARTSNGFQTNTPPAIHTQGVAPGLTQLLFDQLFDSNNVPGVTNPNQQDIPFYLADPIDSPLFDYHPMPGNPGIMLSIVDMISAATAAVSWIQLACATPDTSGSALTFQATGTALYTADLQAYGTMLASSNSNASSIFVDTASTFIVGDYILINGGNVTQEVSKIIGYSPPNKLLLTGTNYSHLAGEVVYTCGRKFWMRCTVPLGAAQGEAANFYNLSLRTYFAKRSRL